MGKVDTNKPRVIAIWGTASSEKFLNRIKSLVEPDISFDVISGYELSRIKPRIIHSEFVRILLIFFSAFQSLFVATFSYLDSCASRRIHNKTNRKVLSPFASWYRKKYIKKIRLFYQKPESVKNKIVRFFSVGELELFFRQAEGLSKLISDKQYDLLLLPGENILLGSPLIISHAKRIGLTTVIYDFTSDAEKGWINYFTNPGTLHSKLENFISIQGWNKYQIYVNGKNFALPISAQALAEVTNHSPRKPWSVCGGHADFYLAPNDKLRKFYVEYCGIEQQKVMQITSVEESLVKHLKSKQFDSSENTELDRVVVLLPPDQFTGDDRGINSRYRDWGSMVASMLNYVMQSRTFDMKIVAVLHPRTEDRLEKLESKHPDIVFTTDDAINQFVRAKYIFSGSSGLDETVVNLGIPIVIWNVYGFDQARYLPESEFVKFINGNESPLSALKQMSELQALPHLDQHYYPDLKSTLTHIASQCADISDS